MVAHSAEESIGCRLFLLSRHHGQLEHFHRFRNSDEFPDARLEHALNLGTGIGWGTYPKSLHRTERKAGTLRSNILDSAACSSPLNFETENYTSLTGALVDWVNVPSLSAGSVIYACYGNSAVTTDQSHPSSTWNSSYVAVYHLLASSTGTLQTYDSTANGNVGTISGTLSPGSGIFAGSGEYNSGSNNSIEADSVATALATSNITYSAWVNLSSTYTSGSEVITTLADAPSANDAYLEFGSEGLGDGQDGRLGMSDLNGSSFNSAVSSQSSFAAGTWDYVVGTYSSTGGECVPERRSCWL